MKFGIRYCNTGRYVDPTHAVELVQAAEAAGFEPTWTVEHTVILAVTSRHTLIRTTAGSRRRRRPGAGRSFLVMTAMGRRH
jgi:alkanesulfonate monooxygenase SsuD/methylene tetrahydromethanopterin reductase-like flavin-dependent oxidoreductase (luciferase family)